MGITRACSKRNIMFKTVAELSKRIKEALEIAISRRPGPVLALADLHKDVQAAISRKPIPMASTLPAYSSAASFAAKEISQKYLEGTIHCAARLINIAKKSIIYAGQRVITSPEGQKLLKKLADKACIPVTTTIKG